MNMRLFLLSLMAYALLSAGMVARGADGLPTAFDLVMLAGADYQLNLTNTNSAGAAINISGYQFKAQYRSAPSPVGTLFATYSTAITTAASGQFKVTLSKAQTAKLSGSSGVWDLLQIDNTGRYTYLLSGKGTVRATVTR